MVLGGLAIAFDDEKILSRWVSILLYLIPVCSRWS